MYSVLSSFLLGYLTALLLIVSRHFINARNGIFSCCRETDICDIINGNIRMHVKTLNTKLNVTVVEQLIPSAMKIKTLVRYFLSVFAAVER